METKDFGHGVNVQHVKRGESDEYKLRIGNFPVKNFSDEDEAEDAARKLAQQKEREKR